MLQNAYSLAKIGADTAENEQHFAEICQFAPRPPHRRAHEGLQPAGPAADRAAVPCWPATRELGG